MGRKKRFHTASTRTGQSIFSIADIGVLTDYVGFYSGIAVTLTVAPGITPPPLSVTVSVMAEVVVP